MLNYLKIIIIDIKLLTFTHCCSTIPSAAMCTAAVQLINLSSTAAVQLIDLSSTAAVQLIDLRSTAAVQLIDLRRTATVGLIDLRSTAAAGLHHTCYLRQVWLCWQNKLSSAGVLRPCNKWHPQFPSPPAQNLGPGAAQQQEETLGSDITMLVSPNSRQLLFY